MHPIYVDYNATTPLRPEVFQVMEPFLREHYGNPSSFHRLGQKSRAALEDSRNLILKLLGHEEGDLFFTSSATEANNLALRGFAFKNNSGSKRKIITTAIEHLSVLKPLEDLSDKGYEVVKVLPNSDGLVTIEEIKKNINENTLMVSVMFANNETGVIQPVEELSHFLKENNIYFHVDAAQVFGKMPFDFSKLKADSIAISAHKIGGPKGVGALWVKEKKKLEPILLGGHHEQNIRPGTENLPAIVGFGEAARLSFERMDKEQEKIRCKIQCLESAVLKHIPDVFVNGQAEPRLANTSNISFLGVDTETLLILLDSNQVCASSGSACTSGSWEPSHVLEAMKLSPERIRSAIRFSIGFDTTDAEIQYLTENLPSWVEQLRK